MAESRVYLLVFVVFVCQICKSQIEFGHCQFSATSVSSGLSGYAYFVLDTTSNNVTVTVNVSGVNTTQSTVGVHVHEFGDISDSAQGLATGLHLVGQGSNTHACPTTSLRHEGDMGNWPVAGGVLSASRSFDLLTLTGGSSIIGYAVIVHADTDDCVTQPTGKAGARLAQCVIGVGNPATIASTSNNTATSVSVSLTTAVCTFSPTSNWNSTTSSVGSRFWATTLPNSGGIRFTGQFFGLTAIHGIHIHTFGDLSAADGTSSGSHYNPANVLHQLPPTLPRHQGDLGNIQNLDTASGIMWYDWNVTDGTPGALSDLLGRAVIVHQIEDHGAGAGCDQAGSAGKRVLQCVLGVANATAASSQPPLIPIAINNSWVVQACTTTAPTTMPPGPSTTPPISTSPNNTTPAPQPSGDSGDTVLLAFVIIFAILDGLLVIGLIVMFVWFKYMNES